jgi:hypothetical protein
MKENSLVIRRLDRLIDLHVMLLESIERWEGKDEQYHRKTLEKR